MLDNSFWSLDLLEAIQGIAFRQVDLLPFHVPFAQILEYFVMFWFQVLTCLRIVSIHIILILNKLSHVWELYQLQQYWFWTSLLRHIRESYQIVLNGLKEYFSLRSILNIRSILSLWSILKCCLSSLSIDLGLNSFESCLTQILFYKKFEKNYLTQSHFGPQGAPH